MAIDEGESWLGSDCYWRRKPARRVAWLRNADAYYHEVAKALRAARRQIWILAWDFDQRVELTRGREDDRLPPWSLGRLLEHQLEARPELHLRVLVWDKAVAFAHGLAELEEMQPLALDHPRAELRLDAAHPPLSSPHQKLVVIDDRLAFSGGMDLTLARWDTGEHDPEDARRRQPDGQAYRPYHDVQMLVDGPAARTLGDLARRRWQRATGQRLPPLEAITGSEALAGDAGLEQEGSREDAAVGDPWPEGLEPDLRDVDVIIARTEPEQGEAGPIYEIEALYRRAIERAEQGIFIEQQYFTDEGIVDALARRLEEPEGPELILILPRDTTGWVARLTMESLLPERLRRLEKADDHDRLRVVYPDAPGIPREAGSSINVHAKLMIVDDRYIQVGSANINFKSMRYDSECDLAVEVGSSETGRTAIRRFRHLLLAEHLGCGLEAVARAETEAGSQREALDRLRDEHPGRLRDFDPGLSGWLIDALALLPWPRPVRDRPIDARELEGRPGLKAWPWLLAVAALVALAIAWRWGPLAQWAQPESLAGWLAGEPWAGPALLGLYLIGCQLMLPVHLLHLVALLGLGPREGMLWAAAGSMASALLSYVIGARYGRSLLRNQLGPRVRELSRRAGGAGLRGALLLRLAPGLPYGLVNMVFGASHIRLGTYLTATAMIMLPTPLLIALVGERAASAWLDPSPRNLLGLGLSLGLVLAAVWGLRRLYRRWAGEEEVEAPGDEKDDADGPSGIAEREQHVGAG